MHETSFDDLIKSSKTRIRAPSLKQTTTRSSSISRKVKSSKLSHSSLNSMHSIELEYANAGPYDLLKELLLISPDEDSDLYNCLYRVVVEPELAYINTIFLKLNNGTKKEEEEVIKLLETDYNNQDFDGFEEKAKNAMEKCGNKTPTDISAVSAIVNIYANVHTNIVLIIKGERKLATTNKFKGSLFESAWNTLNTANSVEKAKVGLNALLVALNKIILPEKPRRSRKSQSGGENGNFLIERLISYVVRAINASGFIMMIMKNAILLYVSLNIDLLKATRMHALIYNTCGSFGCFLNNAEAKEIIVSTNWEDNITASYTVSNNNNIRLVEYSINKLGILSYITNNNLGIKIMKKKNDNERLLWIDEIEAIQNVYDALGPEYVPYVPYVKDNNNIFGFELKKDNHPTMVIISGNEKYNADNLLIIPTVACQNDLDKLKLNPDSINIKMLNSIKASLMHIMTQLHTHRLAHMDIKPNNIVQCDGKFKVIDYGLVCKFDQTLHIAGTPGNISPVLFYACKENFNIGELDDNIVPMEIYQLLINENINSYNIYITKLQTNSSDINKKMEMELQEMIYIVNDRFGIAVTLLELYNVIKVKDKDNDNDFVKSLYDLVKFPTLSLVPPPSPTHVPIPAPRPARYVPTTAAPTSSRKSSRATPTSSRKSSRAAPTSSRKSSRAVPTPAQPLVPPPPPTHVPIPAPRPARYVPITAVPTSSRKSSRAAPIRKNN
jgi:hypothetical protein